MIPKLPVTAEYKNELKKAVFHIIIFFLIYLLLILLAVGLAVVLGFFAIKVFTFKFSFWSAIIAAGMLSSGLFIIFFLIKFIFKSYRFDYSNYVEITRAHQPKIFKIIDEVVNEVGTQQPLKVYISPDVNASVSYNSDFWSMIFPSRKNLTIGIGLVNTTNVSELKAIIAHEFGHFSQKSMKVGSFVHQANKMIHNMLYDTEGFDKAISGWAKVSWVIQIFMLISIKIINGIQWILRKTFDFLYLKHMSLSRQMEFDADRIATYVVGSDINATSLLRVDISDLALQKSLQHHINNTTNTKNIYENQSSTLHFLSKKNNYEIIDGLPNLKDEELKKYDRTKLKIEDQWSSHPTIEQRIKKIREHKIPVKNLEMQPAKTLFEGYEKFCEKLTEKLMLMNGNSSENFVNDIEFINEFEQEHNKFEFSEIFNEYYDFYNPKVSDTILDAPTPSDENFEKLYSDEAVNKTILLKSYNEDIETLKNLNSEEINIKTFDYDGIKYTTKQGVSILKKIEAEKQEIENFLKNNDEKIYRYFYEKASDKDGLKHKYKVFRKIDEAFDAMLEAHNQFTPHIQFMFQVLEPDQIITFRKPLLQNEKIFKEKLQMFYDLFVVQKYLNDNSKNILNDYLVANNQYFINQEYLQNEVDQLLIVLQEVINAANEVFMLAKKNLLDEQSKIYNEISAK